MVVFPVFRAEMRGFLLFFVKSNALKIKLVTSFSTDI